jgi:hypothetical protein
MRTFEFLAEASIFTRPEKYTYGHKVRVATGSQKGQALELFIKQKIPDFDPKEDLEWVKSAPRGSTVVQAGKGNERGYFKRPNGKYITIQGTQASFEKALTHAPGQKGSTAENVGDLSEPVLSAGVVAKLIKRGADSIENITVDDLKNVLNSALDSNGHTYSVKDMNSKIADEIKFTIAIRGPALEFLKSENFWKTFGNKVDSAVDYANSGQIDRYADYFYKNGKADSIVIRSDGMSAQKERKTDIEAFANGRPLKNLNISLKAGSPHIGQVGGGSVAAPTSPKGVHTNAVKLFGPLGIDIPAPTRAVKSKVAFWVSAYKTAAKQLKSMLAGEDAKKEAGIVSKIAEYATSHGSAGDPNVKLVSLAGGVSSIHSFANLVNKMQAEDINLDAVYREGTSTTGDPRPEIRIFDKTSKRPLLYIRYSSTTDEKKVWNTIEMRELLKDLTTLSYRK